MVYNRKPRIHSTLMRITPMQLLPVCMTVHAVLGTRLPLRLGQSLGRLDREILVVHCLVQRIVVASRLMIIPLGVATRHPTPDSLKLALQVGGTFFGFSPCEVDAFKVGVLLLESRLRMLELGLQRCQYPCRRPRAATYTKIRDILLQHPLLFCPAIRVDSLVFLQLSDVLRRLC